MSRIQFLTLFRYCWLWRTLYLLWSIIFVLFILMYFIRNLGPFLWQCVLLAIIWRIYIFIILSKALKVILPLLLLWCVLGYIRGLIEMVVAKHSILQECVTWNALTYRFIICAFSFVVGWSVVKNERITNLIIMIYI